MKEVWKPIILDDIQLRYAVSNYGRVIDIKNRKYMNINDNGAGYKNIPLMAPKSILRVRYVHRLVAHAFIENPEGKPQVGHKDHDRSNNHVDNLYWTTQKQNTKDGIDAGRINAKKRPNMQKLSKSEICQIALYEHQGLGVNEIAGKMGYARTTISSVFNKRSNWELFSHVRKEFSTP